MRTPDPPVFLLGGADSSGTTLVASVLDGLCDLQTGPETWLFHHPELYTTDDDRFSRLLYRLLTRGGTDITMVVDRLRVQLRPGGLFVNRDAYGFPEVDDEYALLQASSTVEGYIEAALSRRPTPGMFIDQTPANACASREYLARVPGARFIHVLRDGRDVVASLLRRWSREAPGHTVSTYLSGAAVNWSYDVSQALRARDLPGYLEVRYESFVRDPLGQTNRILAHLGRPAVDQATFDQNRARQRQQAMRWGDKPSWGATPDQPITDRSVGRWREHFGPDVEAGLRSLRYTIAEEGDRPYCFGEVLQRAGYGGPPAVRLGVAS